MCNLHRRQFLASGALTLGGMVGGFPASPSATPTPSTTSCVVVVFLRGGIDGLSLAMPLAGRTAATTKRPARG